MIEHLFSYGTLQKDEVQLAIFGRLLSGAGDVLNGYKISSVKVSDPVFLSKGEQDVQLTVVSADDETEYVEGTVFEISEQELRLADTYEPDEYSRIKVRLGSGRTAWAFAADNIA